MSEWIVKQNQDGQLEVVGLLIRCKDCKHFCEWGNVTGACRRSKNSWNWLGVDPTDYCSFAERKEE